MIGQTLTARLQIENILRYYVSKNKDRAAELLLDAIQTAYARISNYPELRRWSYLWIVEHRYWFGYNPRPEKHPLVTNVFYETSNMPRLIAAEDVEVPVDW